MKFIAVTVAMLLAVAVADAAEKSGHLEGTLVSHNAARNEITVAHGEVPGVMGTMTMPYEVRGQRVDALPKDGSRITAILHEDNGSYWLTNVQPLAAKPAVGGRPSAAEPMAGMQHEHASPSAAEPMGGMQHDATSDLLMRQASGTSMNPQATPMHMLMTHYGDWMLMAHGVAFVNQVVQSGPRGRDKFFSTNWAMGMADRPTGGGHLMLRAMLSLEPATVGDEYPELFQTGETLHGRPIVDAQHPHDFFMELAAEYAHPVAADTIGYIYAAPVGDPSLGPVAFPHRASASEIPQATLSHHVQDSTHIAARVLTIGAQRGQFGASFSGFHGREPDDKRWNIDTGKIDSWAARLTWDPTPNWTAQISTGHLRHPEELESGNVQRTTASVAYSAMTNFGQWDSSLIFGHNNKRAGHSVSAWTAESVLHFGRNYVTGRGEIVDKDELFTTDDASRFGADVFRIRALTLGYSRDLVVTDMYSGAVGGNVTLYSVPSTIRPQYGSSPHSFYVFVRLRSMAM